jgi:hypothetical protein
MDPIRALGDLRSFIQAHAKESACLLAGCVLGYLIAWSGGRWVSTGNGRTILNTRTGEIRNSFTGKPIVESNESQLDVEERDRLRRAAREGEAGLDRVLAQFQERRKRLGLPALEVSNEDRALWLVDAPANGDSQENRPGSWAVTSRPAQPMPLQAGSGTISLDNRRFQEEEKAIARNAALFKQLQQFIASHPTIIVSGTNVAWQYHTKAFRVTDRLGAYEREQLLDVLGKARLDERYRGDKTIQQAIDALKAYQPLDRHVVSP